MKRPPILLADDHPMMCAALRRATISPNTTNGVLSTSSITAFYGTSGESLNQNSVDDGDIQGEVARACRTA
jgi:hypothetical protein